MPGREGSDEGQVDDQERRRIELERLACPADELQPREARREVNAMKIKSKIKAGGGINAI